MLDNNELRYDDDKRRVLQEVQTQYEVEKQQLELDKLAAENRSNRWIMVALWLLLLLLVIGYWLLVMGRRNAEAKLYEAALEADNMRQTIQCLESQTDVESFIPQSEFVVICILKSLKSEEKREQNIILNSKIFISMTQRII